MNPIAKKTILSLAVFFCLFIFSNSALADGLVTCGVTEDAGNRCTLCHLFIGIRDIIDWGKNILVVAAIVAIVAGAIMYIISAGNSAMMESAKGIIKQAIWGVVIVLGAWVIVNTILFLITSKLYDTGGAPGSEIFMDIANWSTFSCDTKITGFSNNCAFKYSEWTPTPCVAGDTQTRTVLSSSPADCTGTPILSRSCSNTTFSCSDNKCTQVNDAIENNAYGVDPDALKAIIVGGEGCNNKLSSDGKGSCGYGQVLPKYRTTVCNIPGTAEETCAAVQNDIALDINCAAKFIKTANPKPACTATIEGIASCYNTGQPGQCAKATANYCTRVSNYLNNCN